MKYEERENREHLAIASRLPIVVPSGMTHTVDHAPAGVCYA